MLQTIFFNTKALVITDNEKELMKNSTQYAGATIVKNPDDSRLNAILDGMLEGDGHTLILGPMEEMLMLIKKRFSLVPAAGGLVYNPQQELLMIFRRGKWDLPKGKLDEGEDLPTCAVREVSEETGLHDLELEKPLIITYHTYSEKGKQILKESHWFLMHCTNNQPLVPQTDEDIEKCEWVSAKNLIPYLENTHPSIIEVLRKGLRELHLASS